MSTDITRIKYKVLIIGNSNVGKTSLLLRHVDGKFTEDVPGTLGVDYKSNTYFKNNKRYDLQIWDTAGQDRFLNVTRAYYRDAHAALLVFDLNNYKSFEAIPQWHNNLLEQLNKKSNDVVIMLIGTKSDLPPVVPIEDITEMASRLNIPTFIQTSSKKGDKVNEVFTQLLEKLISKELKEEKNDDISFSIIDLNKRSMADTKKNCCT